MALLLFLTLFLPFLYPQDTLAVDVWTNPCSPNNVNNSLLPFCDTGLSFEERAYDLVYNRYSLSDLVALTDNSAGAVSQYSIPPYQWWNDAEHGVAGSPGLTYDGPITSTTMFPQTIGTGSTLNRTLWSQIGTIISTEFRALFNCNQSSLTIWSPNINIFRDPRWGRGQETCGEDPMVNGQYAEHWVRGMQGEDSETYLKVSATCKHFAAYSFENLGNLDRHNFDAVVNDYDLNDTYFPAFKSCVREGGASSIMCSYNEVNGVPSCANKWLLTDILRNEWGFYGYVVSDCSAVENIPETHNYTEDNGQTCSVVYKAGMDIECGSLIHGSATKAIESGELLMSDLQAAIYRATLVQFRMGFFDPPSSVPWSQYGPSDVITDYNLQTSLDAARQSIVLLQNVDSLLPVTSAYTADATNFKSNDKLHKNGHKVAAPGKTSNKNHVGQDVISTVAVIGPNADNSNVLKGNYYGTAPFIYTVLDGIQTYVPASNVSYTLGCEMRSDNTSGFDAAISAAQAADLTVLVMGLDNTVEGESRDRKNLSFPGVQADLIAKVSAVAKKTVLVLLSGGCVDVSNFTGNSSSETDVDAIFWAGYSGMYGGLAVADVIFGTFNPTGRVTQTWYTNEFVNEVAVTDMGMRRNGTNNPGRGYRYYGGDSINFPFGFGLSYTQFECSALNEENDDVFSVTVTNIGNVDGGGVVMLYFVPQSAGQKGTAWKRLVGFERFDMLQVEESVNIDLSLYKEFTYTDDFKQSSGVYKLGGVCDLSV